ncbi:hypothetical protein Peur_069723 [Populus x canadensis]
MLYRLKDIRNVGLPSSKLGSDVSPPSEHISSNGIQDRTAEKLSNASPVGICDRPIQSLSSIESLQCTFAWGNCTCSSLRSCMCDLASQLFCSPIRLFARRQNKGCMTGSSFNG